MVRPIASAIGRTRGSRRLGLALLQSQAAEALGWSQAAVPGCAMKVSAPSVRLERVKPRPVVREPDPVSSNVTLIDPPEVLSRNPSRPLRLSASNRGRHGVWMRVAVPQLSCAISSRFQACSGARWERVNWRKIRWDASISRAFDRRGRVRFLDQAEESRLRDALKARDEEMQNRRTAANERRQKRHKELLPRLRHFGTGPTISTATFCALISAAPNTWISWSRTEEGRLSALTVRLRPIGSRGADR